MLRTVYYLFRLSFWSSEGLGTSPWICVFPESCQNSSFPLNPFSALSVRWKRGPETSRYLHDSLWFPGRSSYFFDRYLSLCPNCWWYSTVHTFFLGHFHCCNDLGDTSPSLCWLHICSRIQSAVMNNLWYPSRGWLRKNPAPVDMLEKKAFNHPSWCISQPSTVLWSMSFPKLRIKFL